VEWRLSPRPKQRPEVDPDSAKHLEKEQYEAMQEVLTKSLWKPSPCVREAGTPRAHMPTDVQLKAGGGQHKGMISEMRPAKAKLWFPPLKVISNPSSYALLHFLQVKNIGQVFGFINLIFNPSTSFPSSLFLFFFTISTTRSAAPAAYAADVTYGTEYEFGLTTAARQHEV